LSIRPLLDHPVKPDDDIHITPDFPRQELLLHLFLNAPCGFVASPSLSKRGLGGVRVILNAVKNLVFTSRLCLAAIP
jgi:hypothetical protein